MTNERVSELFCDIKLNLPNASLLYSVDDWVIPELVQPLREAAVTFMSQPGNAEKTMDEQVLPFLETLQINDAEKQKIEEETRDQNLSEQWRDQRLDRITASIIHDVMTKVKQHTPVLRSTDVDMPRPSRLWGSDMSKQSEDQGRGRRSRKEEEEETKRREMARREEMEMHLRRENDKYLSEKIHRVSL
ncbi:hypothetical protein ACROYT_G015045 [Oculina patagonica]